MQVATWSAWLSALLSMREPNPAEAISVGALEEQPEQPAEEAQRLQRHNLLKATGELLMQLPKDMIDMAMRREVLRKSSYASRMHSSFMYVQ